MFYAADSSSDSGNVTQLVLEKITKNGKTKNIN